MSTQSPAPSTALPATAKTGKVRPLSKSGGYHLTNANVIGPIVSRLRYQRRWTQDMLAARLQLQGCDASRDVVANLESRRCVVTDRLILALLRVFRIRLVDLFPPGVDFEKSPTGGVHLYTPTGGQPAKAPATIHPPRTNNGC